MKLTNLKYLWITLLVILLDQASKAWVFHHFTLGEVFEVSSMLNITLAYNTGAAFSFLNDAGGWQNVFFIVLVSGILMYVLIWLLKLEPGCSKQHVALSMLLGGGLGNLIDRLHRGFVVDFIDAHIGEQHWPAFNVADSMVCIAVVLLVWGVLFRENGK